MPMPNSSEALKGVPRLLIEAELKPVAGRRIQPTGFPDLGAATYDVPDGRDRVVATLLVESAQSMANRLEAVCWDEAANGIAPELEGLPYVNVTLKGIGSGSDTTNSLLEFHRLNSPYIMSGQNREGRTFADVLTAELGLATTKKEATTGTGTDKEPDDVAGVINLRRLAQVCFRYDPNSIVHGIFLEKIAGRLRHPRAVSAFIEATGVRRADSGGVKFDRVLPKPKVAGVDAKGGYGNVPFHRVEFTAERITAYFSLDLAQIRGYGLGDGPTRLLTTLALWKVRKFLDSNMRLRSACELELVDDSGRVTARRPVGYELPPADELDREVADLIRMCKSHFATPEVTELTWSGDKRKPAGGKVEIELDPKFPPFTPLAGEAQGLVKYQKKVGKKPAKLILKDGLSDEVIARIEAANGDAGLVAFLRAKLAAGGSPPAAAEGE